MVAVLLIIQPVFASENSSGAGPVPQPVRPRVHAQEVNIVGPVIRHSQNTLTHSQNADKPEVDWQSQYFSELHRRIYSTWKSLPREGEDSSSDNYKGMPSVVVFKIARDGKLSDLKLERSCGVPDMDKRAMKGVENSAPFAPLPAAAPDHLDLQFTYNLCPIFKGTKGEAFKRF
jgi:TonB family protein